MNRLYNMSKRNIPEDKFDFHFYCYTDDATGLYDDINVIDFPDIPNIHPKYWFGSEDFKYGMADVGTAKKLLFSTLITLVMISQLVVLCFLIWMSSFSETLHLLLLIT